MIRARITITLKDGVLDPEANALMRSFDRLGFADIIDLRQSRQFDITMRETNTANARKTLTRLCDQILANGVIETYDIAMERAAHT